MKRPLRNQILAASVIAACVGCSRSGHVYSIHVTHSIYVEDVRQHFWGSADNYIMQFRTPFDAQGRECHRDPEKVAEWRTFTEIYTRYNPGHYRLCVRGPIWAVGVVLCTAVGAVFMMVEAAASRAFRKIVDEKHGA